MSSSTLVLFIVVGHNSLSCIGATMRGILKWSILFSKPLLTILDLNLLLLHLCRSLSTCSELMSLLRELWIGSFAQHEMVSCCSSVGRYKTVWKDGNLGLRDGWALWWDSPPCLFAIHNTTLRLVALMVKNKCVCLYLLIIFVGYLMAASLIPVPMVFLNITAHSSLVLRLDGIGGWRHRVNNLQGLLICSTDWEAHSGSTWWAPLMSAIEGHLIAICIRWSCDVMLRCLSHHHIVMCRWIYTTALLCRHLYWNGSFFIVCGR